MSSVDTGTVLVIAGKPDAGSFVRAAMRGSVSRVTRAESMQEARRLIGAGKASLMVAFMPLTDGGLDEIIEIEERKSVPSVILVGPEMYEEALYRTRRRRIFVLAYPARKSVLAQTVNILMADQEQIAKIVKERDALREKLADQTVINRAKLLLIEGGMSEDEAHHHIEHLAMDKGITKRKAAELVIAENRRS